MKESTEEMIVRLECVAPRVTPEKLKEVIKDVMFFKPTGTLMICVITLRNGFCVTGESACAAPENFRQEIGEKISYEMAQNKVWMLEGYLLKERLWQQKNLSEASEDAI